MIQKLLVANRGEIARRVFRTCHELGIATVAVYSDADADAPFVHEADEAVPLGGTTPAESYLRAEKVIEAARLTGADAVHPGYGFLSENADFARACVEAGITFVGPSPEAIALMGSKLGAREMMEKAGVPVLPGADLTDVDDADVLPLAEKVGWPILVKASFGGGGRGMRVVREPAELLDAIASARREAGAAFGNDTVFLEHYVDSPRHVEIQIFGDQQGTVVHLNERECSIQRRHQKIVEESPSPAVTPELRATMGRAAIAAGEVLDYVGAGTVEFLLAPDGRFFFLEVNTRLQVEHPVTELVTGLDLVRLQIEVANGKPLPEEARAPRIQGHAIEVRLYAEDPANDYLPAAGRLAIFEIADGDGIRLDGGVVSGDVISTNYDPMLAKVIAYGDTREQASARLARTLRRSRIYGVTTNQALLVGILEHPEFVAGAIDTHFLDRVPTSTLIEEFDEVVVHSAALAAALADTSRNREAATVLAPVTSGFRNNPSMPQSRDYRHGSDELRVEYRLGRAQLFQVNGSAIEATVVSATPSAVELVTGGVRRAFAVTAIDGCVYVTWARGTVALDEVPRFPDATAELAPGSLVAPMPGTVVRVAVEPGAAVDRGDVVVIIEAMKMEHSVTAPAAGIVTSVPVTVGQGVDTGTLLVVLDEDEA